MRRLIVFASFVALHAACGNKATSKVDAAGTDPGAPTEATPGTGIRSVSLKFAPVVGASPFSCTATYPAIGTPPASYQPADFRLYVSNPALVRRNGTAVPVTLEEDGVWQAQNVGLLDFEDHTGTCINGTPETHTALTGRAPDFDDYVGLRFDLGVPFALDHQDASAAAPPFDQVAMFWNWQFGYKFLSIDGKVNGTASHSVHVGSTGCTTSSPNVVDACSAPNIATITLSAIDVDKQEITVDLAALMAGSDLTDTGHGAAMGGGMGGMSMPNGCMSEASNPNCAPLFARLGLPFGGSTPTAQSVFAAR